MAIHQMLCESTPSTSPAAVSHGAARRIRTLSDRLLRDGAGACAANMTSRGLHAVHLSIDDDGWIIDSEGRRCLALDTETGGLDSGSHALLAIGVQPLCVVPVTGRTEYISPASGLSVNPKALAVNGLSPDALASLGASAEVTASRSLNDYLTLMGNGQPWRAIAHGADFDRGFLWAAEARTGVAYPIACWADTRETCRTLRAVHGGAIPADARNTLDTLFEALFAPTPRGAQHQVEQDVAMLADCAIRLARTHVPVVQQP